MLGLRDNHRHGFKTSDDTPIGVGDVVLVHDDNNPRGFWKVALVKSLIIGKDHRVRGAILKVASSREVLQRPLQRLYPLEVKCSTVREEGSGGPDNEATSSATEIEDSDKLDMTKTHCPRRAAAQRSDNFNKAVALYEQDEFSD